MGAMKKPGEIVPQSGIYKSAGGREAALSRGDRFPPTMAGSGWTEVQLTKTVRTRSNRGTAKKRARK
jgi:hypothetical protein